MECAHVNSPLEIDDFAHRRPIVGPAPAVELRGGGGIEPQLRFVGEEFEQEPALLLPYAAVAYVLPRQAIAQPAARRGQHLDVAAFQADFLFEFAKQRFLDPFAAIDAALGKLPTTAADTAAQEYLSRGARQHDSHVRAETVLVDVVDGGLDGHGSNCSISPAACGRGAGDLRYPSHETRPIAPVIVADRTIERRACRFG